MSGLTNKYAIVTEGLNDDKVVLQHNDHAI